MLDRDEREEAEVKRLATQLGDKAKLIVLKKRELENYLLCPKAIAKFIRQNSTVYMTSSVERMCCGKHGDKSG
jgi:hypothetical protein